MIENANHLTGVAMVAFAATLCGGAFARLGQPAIIGYILAGAVLGPGGLGLVENREAITVLAELGVILLLYFVGMELSLQSFRAIWRLSITTAMAQIIIATGCMVGVGSLFGWPPSISLLVGFCLAISSTAVTIEVLDSMGNLRSSLGKLTIGILIAQDLAVGPMLLLLSGVHQDGAGWKIALEVGLSIAILIIAIALLSKRKKLNMPWHRLWATRDDLIPLAAL
ncbi:MAG: cation:proton antiporter, partial [Pseudomonadota bacterium]